MAISMNLVYQYMAIFFTFSPIRNHIHSLQVENCDSKMMKMTMVNSGLKGLTDMTYWGLKC